MIEGLKFVPTTCPYCGTGCSFYLVVSDNKVLGIEPWHSPPVNEGKLCQKGRYAHEFIHSKDRLTRPLIKRDGVFVESTWDEALRLIAEKFKSYQAGGVWLPEPLPKPRMKITTSCRNLPVWC